MKKLSSVIFILLFVLSFSCKEEATKKDTDSADSNSTTTTSSSSISCGSATLSSVSNGKGECNSRNCAFNKTSTSYTIKVSFSGVSSARSILVDEGNSSVSISNVKDSSSFTLSGKTPSSKDSSYTIKVIVRDLELCKKSKSSSDCDVSGKVSSPSAQNSKWDETCSVTISTSSSASGGSGFDWSAICNLIGQASEDAQEWCSGIKGVVDAFSSLKSDD